MTIDPTLTPLLDILATLDEEALAHVYNINRTDDAPLDKALFAWRDAGAKREKALTSGELVTLKNVGALPVGTVVRWRIRNCEWLATKTAYNQWSVPNSSLPHPYTDADVATDTPPAHIVSVPE